MIVSEIINQKLLIQKVFFIRTTQYNQKQINFGTFDKMQTVKQNLRRAKTHQKLSMSEHVMAHSKNKNSPFKNMNKTLSHNKISPHQTVTNKLRIKHVRSQTSQGLKKKMQNPYDNFVKEMAIILPSPKDKFYEFIQVPPFNRNSHHLQLIQHFLRQYKFFKNHPFELLIQIAKKIKIEHKKTIAQKMIAIVESGQCLYQKQKYLKGDVFGRHQLRPDEIICTPQTKFFTINRHQYKYLISDYLEKEKEKFRSFLLNLQIFKMFSKKAFERFIQTLKIQFLNPGEHLYHFGDLVNQLCIVYQGKASRKVIVEIDRVNKIPLLRYSKIVKILSKSYEHKIQFQREDLIGLAQIIDNIETRKQNIKIEQHTIILTIDRSVIQQNLDEYIVDRMRKQNMKKYPVTYDKLCQKFEKQKVSLRQEQLRKIEALKSTINPNLSQKKSQKINLIIKKYQENIKKSQLRNLLECKIQQRSIHRQ